MKSLGWSPVTILHSSRIQERLMTMHPKKNNSSHSVKRLGSSSSHETF